VNSAYFIEAKSADILKVRDAVTALGDSGWHPSAILPASEGKTEVYHWDDQGQAEDAAKRLTDSGMPARVRSAP
jgi:hypothetical protein